MNNYQKYCEWLADANSAKWVHDRQGTAELQSFLDQWFEGMDPYYSRHIGEYIYHGIVPPVISPNYHSNVISCYVRGILPEEGQIAGELGAVKVQVGLRSTENKRQFWA